MNRKNIDNPLKIVYVCKQNTESHEQTYLSHFYTDTDNFMCNPHHSRIDAWPQIWNLRTIRLEATTGGQIRIRLKAEDIQAEARTSGILEIKGEAQNLQAILKTAARLEARELETQNADIQLSIGAKAEIQVNQRLTYDLYGHSRLVIKGNPQIENSHNHSGSRIIKEK